MKKHRVSPEILNILVSLGLETIDVWKNVEDFYSEEAKEGVKEAMGFFAENDDKDE